MFAALTSHRGRNAFFLTLCTFSRNIQHSFNEKCWTGLDGRIRTNAEGLDAAQFERIDEQTLSLAAHL